MEQLDQSSPAATGSDENDSRHDGSRRDRQ